MIISNCEAKMFTDTQWSTVFIVLEKTRQYPLYKPTPEELKAVETVLGKKIAEPGYGKNDSNRSGQILALHR
jgi:hypothetical protein